MNRRTAKKIRDRIMAPGGVSLRLTPIHYITEQRALRVLRRRHIRYHGHDQDAAIYRLRSRGIRHRLINADRRRLREGA